MPGTLDPTLLIVFAVPLFALLIGLLAIYWEHKRRMELINQGIVPDDVEESWQTESGWWILALGLVLIAVGIGRMVGSYAQQNPLDGTTILLLGIAALAYFYIRRRLIDHDPSAHDGATTGKASADDRS